MVDYAVDVGAAAVQFTMIYALPGSTDVLLMDGETRADVLRQLDTIPPAVWEKEGLHGPGTFLWEVDLFRSRLSEDSAEHGDYDQHILDRVQCSIGWFYTIVRANGDVIPCCKGQNRPMGNIKETAFKEIWAAKRYEVFRAKAKVLPKSDPYFIPFNCYKMCDNVGMLCRIDKEMRRLRRVEEFTRGVLLPIVGRLSSFRSKGTFPSDCK